MGHIPPLVVTAVAGARRGQSRSEIAQRQKRAAPRAALWSAGFGELRAQPIADVGERVVHLLAQHRHHDDDYDGDQNQDQRVFDQSLPLLIRSGPPSNALRCPEVKAAQHLAFLTSFWVEWNEACAVTMPCARPLQMTKRPRLRAPQQC